MKPRNTNLVLTTSIVLLLTTGARAVNYTWDIASTSGIQVGTGIWSTTDTLWTTNGGNNNIAWPGSGTDNDAIFTGNSTANVNSTTLLVDDVTVQTGNVFIQGASAGTRTIQLNGGSYDGTTVSGSQFDVQGTGLLRINNSNGVILGGTADVVKTGTGTLSIGNTIATFTGNIYVLGGTLELFTNGGNSTAGNGSLGNSANDLYLNSGSLSNNTTGGVVTLGSGRDIYLGSATGSGTGTLKGVGSATSGITVQGIVKDNVAGSGSLIWDGASGSILRLDSANTFSGTTKISNGILRLNNTLAMQNSALDTTASVLGSSTDGLRITPTTVTLGGLIGNKNLADVFTTTSGGFSGLTSLTLNPGNGVTNTYSGIISNGAANMTLTKTGAGTQELNAENSYTGSTTINAGVLRLNTSGTISTSSNVNINGTGNFNVRNTSGWIYGGTITGDAGALGQLNLNTGTNATLTGSISNVTINANNILTDTLISGDISGASTTVNVQSSGNPASGGAILRLSGSNSYGGVTTVLNTGTLIVNGNNSLAAGNVTINSGGTLRGIGTVGGATSLASTAHLSAGSTTAVGDVGTEMFSSSLTFDSGSIFDWDINSGVGNGAYDKIVSSILSVTQGAKFAVNSDVPFSDSFWQRDHLWADVFNQNMSDFTVANFLYSVNGMTTSTPDSSTQGSFTSNDSGLMWSAVPEPSSALAGLLVVAGLMRRRRER